MMDGWWNFTLKIIYIEMMASFRIYTITRHLRKYPDDPPVPSWELPSILWTSITWLSEGKSQVLSMLILKSTNLKHHLHGCLSGLMVCQCEWVLRQNEVDQIRFMNYLWLLKTHISTWWSRSRCPSGPSTECAVGGTEAPRWWASLLWRQYWLWLLLWRQY